MNDTAKKERAGLGIVGCPCCYQADATSRRIQKKKAKRRALQESQNDLDDRPEIAYTQAS